VTWGPPRTTVFPCAVGQFVGAPGRAGDDGQADQVGLEVFIHILDALVEQHHLGAEFRRHQRR
jgi:hypothetical protein